VSTTTRRHWRTARWPYGLTLAVALYAPQAAAEITLAANDEVLNAWQRLAQNESGTPTLSTDQGGATVIEWHGAASVESYTRDVVGDSTLTPLRDGSYYKASVQGDLRETTADGTVSYLQFAATHSNDRAVLSQNAQLDLFRTGVAGQDYGFALGDVTTSYSTLGTNTLLRGVSGYKQFGDTLVSASVGSMAESWSAFAGTAPRTRYLSDAYAVKVDFPAGQYGRVFLTTQGFNDDPNSIDSTQQTYTAADASTSTAGFNYQRGAYTVRGEYGGSRWHQKGGDSYDDHASVVDGEWRAESGGIRAGHHDIGRYYSSLSADVTAGIRETYLAGDWAPSQWLGLAADVRTSRNNAAYYASDIRDTDALSLNANLNLEQWMQGLQLMLQHARSLGTSVDSNRQDTDSSGATLSYTSAFWGLQIGNSYQRTDNLAMPAAGSKAVSWNGSVNVTLNRDVETSAIWNADVTLSGSTQRQELNSGGVTESRNYEVSLNAQRLAWGTLALSFGQGWLTQPDGGPELRQQHLQLDASHPWGESNVVRAYVRNEANDGEPTSHYSERTVGVQLSTVW